MTLPTDYDARKAIPIVTGVIDYFPDALAEVARVSMAGNLQHNPEQAKAGILFWDRTKSTDEVNTLERHLVDRGTIDTDGVRHSAKLAWRALANLQKELEKAYGHPLPRACIPPEQRGEIAARVVTPSAHDTQPSMSAVSPGSYSFVSPDEPTSPGTPSSKAESKAGANEYAGIYPGGDGPPEPAERRDPYADPFR